MIELKICKTDIPESKIYKAKNGKEYFTILIVELKEKDQFDNTHTSYMSQTKQEREEKQKKLYVGKGKEIHFK